MKFLFFASAFFFTIGNASHSTPAELELSNVAEAVKSFAGNADARDAEAMEHLLHPEFRAIVNRQFGSSEVSLMDKAMYVDMLKQGKIGGDTRKVVIQSITLEGHNASVRAEFTGQELRFVTFIQLVQSTNGKWQVISDMPNIYKM